MENTRKNFSKKFLSLNFNLKPFIKKNVIDKIIIFSEINFFFFLKKNNFFTFDFFVFSKKIKRKEIDNFRKFYYFQFLKKELFFLLTQKISFYKIRKLFPKTFKKTENLFFFFQFFRKFPFYLNMILFYFFSIRKKKKFFFRHFFQKKDKTFFLRSEILFYHCLRFTTIKTKDLKLFFNFVIRKIFMKIFFKKKNKLILKKKNFCFYCLFTRIGSKQTSKFIPKILMKILSIFLVFFLKKKLNCLNIKNTYFKFFAIEFLRGCNMNSNWFSVVLQIIDNKIRKLVFLINLDNFFQIMFTEKLFYFLKIKSLFLKNRNFYKDLTWINSISRFCQIELKFKFKEKIFFSSFFETFISWINNNAVKTFFPRFLDEKFLNLNEENNDILLAFRKKKKKGLIFLFHNILIKQRKCCFLINKKKKNYSTELYNKYLLTMNKKKKKFQNSTESRIYFKKFLKKKLFFFDLVFFNHFIFFYYKISFRILKFLSKKKKKKIFDFFMKIFYFRLFFIFFFSKTLVKFFFSFFSKEIVNFFNYLGKNKKKANSFFFFTFILSKKKFYVFPQMLTTNIIYKNIQALNFNWFYFLYKKNQKIFKMKKKKNINFFEKFFFKKKKKNFPKKEFDVFPQSKKNFGFYFFGKKIFLNFINNLKKKKKKILLKNSRKKVKFHQESNSNDLLNSNNKERSFQKICIIHFIYCKKMFIKWKTTKNPKKQKIFDLTTNDVIQSRNLSFRYNFSMIFLESLDFLFSRNIFLKNYCFDNFFHNPKYFKTNAFFFSKLTNKSKNIRYYLLIQLNRILNKSSIFWKFSYKKIFFLFFLCIKNGIFLLFFVSFFNIFFKLFKIKKIDEKLYFKKSKKKFIVRFMPFWLFIFFKKKYVNVHKKFEKKKSSEIYTTIITGINPNDLFFKKKKNKLDFQSTNRFLKNFYRLSTEKNLQISSLYFLIFYSIFLYLGFFSDFLFVFRTSKNDPAIRKLTRLFEDEIIRICFFIKSHFILNKLGIFIFLFFEKIFKKNIKHKFSICFYLSFGEKIEKLLFNFLFRFSYKLVVPPNFFAKILQSLKVYLKWNLTYLKLYMNKSSKKSKYIKLFFWVTCFDKLSQINIKSQFDFFFKKVLNHINNILNKKNIFPYEKKIQNAIILLERNDYFN